MFISAASWLSSLRMKVDHARTLPLLLIVALLLAACEQPALPLNVRQAEPTAVALPAELSYNFGDGPLTLDPPLCLGSAVAGPRHATL